MDVSVFACTQLCREHVELVLAARDFPPSEPGQFLELLCRDADAAARPFREWSHDGLPSLAHTDLGEPRPFLRRPFSIADRTRAEDGTDRLWVISRDIGMGTHWLARLQPGDTLNITGPLGRGFRLPPPETPVLLIGGGVGLPPMLYLARHLAERAHADVTAIFGATTHDLLPLRLTTSPYRDGTASRCVELPGNAAYPAIITTDDGTLGMRGRVTDGLAAWHARRGASARSAMVIACGPDGMLRAVARRTRELGLDCQLCVERNMGCGMGTCLSCVVRLRDAGRPAGWRWGLVCSDGPVFARDELLDYCT